MAFNFEKLNVWKLSVEFADEVRILTRKYPKEELFSLTSQFKRASDSISLNIAEGATDNTKPDFKRFLTFASRSFAEVITCLYHSKNRKYIDDETFYDLYNTVEVLYKMISKLKSSI